MVNRRKKPNHIIRNIKILEDLKKELDKKDVEFDTDTEDSFHLVMLIDKGKRGYVSFYISSLNQYIDVQKLGIFGTVDHRFKERRFITPKGAVNFACRKYLVKDTYNNVT